MPVLSPHRGSTSLTGSYRSSLGSSTSGSITEDGITTRFREESRENSIRRDSLSRDSGIGSIRENSILDTSPSSKRERDSSLTRSGIDRDRYNQLSVIESVADLRNKYSPSNYVPAVYRKKENISRSKSINDIGLPPIERADRSSTVTNNATTNSKKKVKDYNNSLGLTELSNTTNTNNDNMYITEDDNGNRQPVSEIRKRFENNAPSSNNKSTSNNWKDRSNNKKDDSSNDIGKEIKRPLKLSKLENDDSPKIVLESAENDVKKMNGDLECNNKRYSVTDRQDRIKDGIELRRSNELNNTDDNTTTTAASAGTGATTTNASDTAKLNGGRSTSNRVNNFSSYIPAKDYEKGDIVNGSGTGVDNRLENDDNNDNRNDMSNLNKSRVIQDKTTNNDLTTSPRINRTSIVQNASTSLSPTNAASTSNNISGRSSLNRDDYDKRLSSSPVRSQGLNGLKNIGNTCFMNSVIQCLSNTKPLLEYVRRDAYTVDINTSISSMKGALIKAFSQVIKELWSEDSSDRVVNTVSLKSQIQRFAPRFMGYAQQDAQEFLRYLLEGLHEDVNRVLPTPTHHRHHSCVNHANDFNFSDAEKAAESWQRYLRMDNSKIVDIFVGQLKSTLRCTHCGHCSMTFDPFWDLSLPIPQKVGQIRLQQCLDSFTREETLDGDEKPVRSFVNHLFEMQREKKMYEIVYNTEVPKDFSYTYPFFFKHYMHNA
ncbi:ubiquitin carboxyl-terminal hydrolase [Holotrichia oblita]|uniref:Ubiquitin carboxyl-terminal hydrolase n=1 Tax=Holotrichia oblita TaxID=644536 RepID=A0ACB9SI37_HOLOL|nr:ubiquitin carboxyl-terminal hydrolase [Holotrichia oblita]